MIEFWIPGEFAKLNPYIDAERSNKFAASKIKKAETRRAELACAGVPAADSLPVRIRYTWHCESRRSDPGNIAFAQKFIEDGMVLAGILPDDGWSEIAGFEHEFVLDKNNPGVMVQIRSAK
jgi:hypothetical protein